MFWKVGSFAVKFNVSQSCGSLSCTLHSYVSESERLDNISCTPRELSPWIGKMLWLQVELVIYVIDSNPSQNTEHKSIVSNKRARLTKSQTKTEQITTSCQVRRRQLENAPSIYLSNYLHLTETTCFLSREQMICSSDSCR